MLVFFDTSGDEVPCHVGIVTRFTPAEDSTPATLETVEGCQERKVQKVTRTLEEPAEEGALTVLCYAALPEKPQEIIEEPTEPEKEPEKESEKVTRTYAGADYTVTVTYGEDANIPEDAELIAQEYPKDSEIYLKRYGEAAELYGWSEDRTAGVRLFHIGFYVNGEEVKPAAPVEIVITYPQAEDADCRVTGFGKAQPEPGAVPENETVPVPETAPISETAADLETVPVSETVSVSNAALISEVVPASEEAPAPEAVPDTDVPTESVTAAETETQPKSEPLPETLKAEVSRDQGGNQSVAFTLDGFSQIMLAMDAPARTIEPGVLDGVTVALYNPANKCTAWPYITDYAALIMPALISEEVTANSFPERDTYFRTAVFTNATTLDLFKPPIYRAFKFIQAASDNGYCIQVESGDKRYYLAIAETGISFSEDQAAASVFTVTEGIDALAGQYMLSSNSYAVSVNMANYQFTSVAVSEATADSYFYLVTRAREPVGTVSGETPQGTVINVFDYWITAPGASDQTMDYDEQQQEKAAGIDEKGINTGHGLKFSSSGTKDYGPWNSWTGHYHLLYDADGKPLIDSDGKPMGEGRYVYSGLVKPKLENGYPVLQGQTAENADTDDPDVKRSFSIQDESLAYLFDPNAGTPNRAVHRNVGGLLQIDGRGYHGYDSTKNYAYLCKPDGQNTTGSQFTLYSRPGVLDESGNGGEFFPFSDYDAAAECISGTQRDLNHYFGLTLTTRFYQTVGGKTNGKDITFEFSGDDDVWIFIDDVLVADLGGIHSAVKVSINFADGTVTINGPAGSSEPPGYYSQTTIKEAFRTAGMNVSSWPDDTLPAGTYHTLKFFYLERGAAASNLKLEYNLVTFPSSGITKVDQVGDPVPGAGFTLYHANSEYVADNAVCSGVTSENGEFVFRNSSGNPISLQDLYTAYQDSPYFVLKETKVPDGYRGTGADIHLKIHTKAFEGTETVSHVMVCENTRDSGAWAAPILQVSAPNSFTPVGESTPVTFYDPATGTTNGKLFGVVLKYVGGDRAQTASWRPVYGSAKDGYTLVSPKNGESFIDAVLEAARHYGGTNFFHPGASGKMEATLEELPGNIEDYNFFAGNDKSKFIIAYYYTDESGNTSRVRDYTDTGEFTFTRNFGTAIQVPNMVNRIAVQKLAEDDVTPLNGATFAMYRVEDKDVNAGGGLHENGDYFYVADENDAIHLYLEPDTNGTYSGQAKNCFDSGWTGTYSVDPGTGKIDVTLGTGSQRPGQYTVTPVKLGTTVGASENNYMEDGIAEFEKIPTGKYIIRELTAPKGYSVNPNHAMVLVTEHAIYANAGTADDNIAVSRGPGYLASNLHYYATNGSVDNTLTWVYAQMKKSGESTHFTDITPGNYGDWEYVTDRRYGVTPSAEPLTSYLVYQNQAADSGDITTARFSYAVDQSTMDPTISGNSAPYRRLYTKTGWSYLEIYQNYNYGYTHKKENADYADWRSSGDLSNLFSRSVYVHVTDYRQSDLEITKTVKLAKGADPAGVPDQAFDFTVELTPGTVPLSGTYKYTVYTVTRDEDGLETGREIAVDTDGNQIENRDLSFAEKENEPNVRVATVTLKHNQAVVIQGIPADAAYTVTEAEYENYTTSAVEKVLKDEVNPTGIKSHEGRVVSGKMYWHQENGTVDNLSKVDFTNTIVMTVRKEDSTSGAALSGAEFTLTREAEGGKKLYHDGTGWVEAPARFTTGDTGEIQFPGMGDGIYTLTEVKAPDGYNLLTSPVIVTMEGGVITSATTSDPSANITVADTATALTVPNSAGYELPKTGGTGTSWFTAGGMMCVGAAAVLFCRRKKRGKEASASF